LRSRQNSEGTGDAVSSARAELENSNSTLLIMSGDVPLVRNETLSKLIEHHNSSNAVCTILSVKLENPPVMVESCGMTRVASLASSNRRTPATMKANP
jgi:bifunctional N-acetylglucosamine-1-phosphate-uridyltransferase/glucosamine-1-phosphate-acetyltransferase GlmU-like protein